MKKLLRHVCRIVTRKYLVRTPPFRERDSLASPITMPAAVDDYFNDVLNAHQAGRLPEAQVGYRRILERSPEYAPALHFLGVSYGQAGDWVEAERLIRKSIQIRDIPEYFCNLALVLDKQGKRDGTETAYRNVLRLAPDNVSIRGSLGDLLIRATRYADAEIVYRAALALHPDDADANFKLGVVLAELRRPAEAVAVYRNALCLRPAYLDAYNNLGNLLTQMCRYGDAEDAFRQALVLQPGSAVVYCNLSRLLQEMGRYVEAEAGLCRALELQPEFVEAHNNLGNLYAAMGRRPEAVATYRRALELQPNYADAHNNLGNLLKDIGNFPEAEAAYRQATALNPDLVDAWGNLGMLLGDTGRFDEAETAHRKALSLQPNNAIAHNNLANLLRKTNGDAEAEVAYRQALALQPDYPDACSNLGNLLQGAGRYAEAELLHRKALLLKPDSVAVRTNFGCLLLEARRFAEAEAIFDSALELQPDFADACCGLGNVFKETGRYVEAEVAYRRAIARQPSLAGAHNNLGFLLQWSERFAEAEAAFRQAVALNPESDLAHYNLALFCLSQKRFYEGWEGYERRWRIKDFNSLQRGFPQLRWQGEVLAGETLLVWQEQGVGDIILYAGMIHDLVGQGARLIVECESRLEPLLARSFPQARVVVRSNPPHVTTLAARWQSPLGSLGRWVRKQKIDFKGRGPYLIPDVKQVAAFRKQYRALGEGPVIGISWRSSNDKVGQSKSMSLVDWAPLLSLPGVIFVNLQYGECGEELSRLKRDTGITVHQDGAVNPLTDIDGFAAQVAAMDLVISTSNSTVHFAGALGVPVWTLLPRGGAGLLWYWFSEGEDSLWYPSMRLFRQPSPGDWSALLLRVAEAFRSFLLEFQYEG